MTDFVRLDQQFVEVLTSGDPSTLKVRIDQQFVEVLTSGDPATLKVRLAQQFVEVLTDYASSIPKNRSFGIIIA